MILYMRGADWCDPLLPETPGCTPRRQRAMAETKIGAHSRGCGQLGPWGAAGLPSPERTKMTTNLM